MHTAQILLQLGFSGILYRPIVFNLGEMRNCDVCSSGDFLQKVASGLEFDGKITS